MYYIALEDLATSTVVILQVFEPAEVKETREGCLV